MKKITLLLLCLMTVSLGFAQATHTIDFEPAGVGADWNWIMDQNDSNPALDFIANPVSGGINTSATVTKFTAKQNGAAWALCITTDDGEFTFDGSNATVKIMVYKPEISDFAVKFEGSSPAIELKVANTLINQWEELTFDFSGQIGNTYNKIVLIPDFQDRDTDNIIYFDNFQLPNGTVVAPPTEITTPAPTPTKNSADVISVYSDTYSSIYTNLNPNWGQSTTASEIQVDGNNTLKYENLNYQGLDYTSTNVSSMEYIHLDYYTDNATNFDFFLIAGGENAYDIDTELGITTGQWVSIDIPLATAFPDRDLTSAAQFKTVGDGTIYLDNLYFWKAAADPTTDATLSDLQIDNQTISGFSGGTTSYDYEVPQGTTIAPQITLATTTNGAANAVITQGSGIPSNGTVLVTAEDGTTQLTYTVSFFSSGPPTAAPTPPNRNASDVASIFSDAYSDISVDTFDTGWCPGTTTEVLIDGNATKKTTNLGCEGVEFVSGRFDATDFTSFHIDVYTDSETLDKSLNLKLSNWNNGGAEANAIEYSLNNSNFLTNPNPGTWISIDIPLDDFTVASNNDDRNDLAQFIISSDLGTIFYDNLYFHKGDDLSVNGIEIEGLKTYPNPTKGTWTISTESQEITAIEVYNVLGAKVISIQPNALSADVDASNLPTGIYMSKITTDIGTVSKKLIKN